MNNFEDKGARPLRKRISVSVTLDNLGEACDMNMGRWRADEPIGQHYTATRVLPRLLEELDGVPFTYFIEAVNAERYPRQLQALRDAGKEVALHSWGHENWARLTPDEQRANLMTSLAALHAIGIEVCGFRPPGGVMDSGAYALLRGSGFTYCSPVSSDSRVRVENGLAVLPFAWRHVDAYLLDPDLAAFRVSHGDRAEPATADQWSRVVNGALDDALSTGQHLTVIFHPYVMGADERLWAVFRDFVLRLRASDDVCISSCREVAQRRMQIDPASPLA